jgi:hypothetical protein
MKLIEGMKQLKIIEKKIDHNTRRITEYAALPSTLKPQFGTDDEQRKQVQSLIQSNIDLASEYMNIKQRVDLTNLKTEVRIGTQIYTISAMLMIKRNMGVLMMSTYLALSDKTAELAVSQNRSKEVPIHVERYYNETDKHNGIQRWQSLLDEIEIRLETINATVDLVDL